MRRPASWVILTPLLVRRRDASERRSVRESLKLQSFLIARAMAAARLSRPRARGGSAMHDPLADAHRAIPCNLCGLAALRPKRACSTCVVRLDLRGPPAALRTPRLEKIGRASCRERV